ncbi:MAG: alpha/beta fold hydrolase [Burkholderiales bacterium]|nr:alpha/beta fold hydrolase [Burkholderiales bacterium]
MWHYKPPPWLPDGHSQTIVPALWGARCAPFQQPMTRDRWTTPDGDFVDVDRDTCPTEGAKEPRPLLVLFHGLEGSSQSHYAQGFRLFARRAGWDYAVPHFRGCSGELNTAARAYHSGDAVEIDWLVQRFKKELPQRDLYAVGISLGGNALMHWAGAAGFQAQSWVKAAAAVSAPLDLAGSGNAMGKGFNRHVYTRMFLQTMRRKAMQKWAQHPGLFSLEQLRSSRTLYEFDNAFTAPVHGFQNTEDYWCRASAKPLLRHIRLPALLLNAQNDPFVPRETLPTRTHVSESVELWQPVSGGHVGFPANTMQRTNLAMVMPMPTAVGAWLQSHSKP